MSPVQERGRGNSLPRLLGETNDSPLRNVRAHRFVSSEPDGVITVSFLSLRGGMQIMDLSYLEEGHDGTRHDTLYTLWRHNNAEDSGNLERIQKTELELPKGIVLEHQPKR